MKLQELTEIGRIKKAHGLNGQLKVVFDSFYTNFLKEVSTLILKKGEDYLPFFIEQIELNAEPPILKFESINTKEEANKMNGKTIYALTAQLPAVKENQLELLEGITVFDERDYEVGVIREVLDLPSQLVLRIEGRTGEVMIPFHEDFIIELDTEQNRLQLQLPEGLLDIYS